MYTLVVPSFVVAIVYVLNSELGRCNMSVREQKNAFSCELALPFVYPAAPTMGCGDCPFETKQVAFGTDEFVSFA